MPIERVLEPEVMDGPDEARDYDAMDHAEVNTRFCADLARAAGAPGDLDRVLDVGAGTARIPVELCSRFGASRVTALDLADAMLDLARANVAAAGLEDRVELVRADAKELPFEAGAFTSAVSNTIVHHVPEPGGVLVEMARVLAPGGLLFVRDLARPESHDDVTALVTKHAAGANPAQRELLRASLCASLTVAEVAELAADVGLEGARVAMTSDRHWTLTWRRAS